MLKKDNLKFGLILGLVAPVFGMLVYYFLKFFPTFSLKDFFTILTLQKSLLTAVISLSLFANAVVFTYYVNKRKDKTAKGIFAITCLYVMVGIIIKFFI